MISEGLSFKGPVILEILATKPSWQAGDEGRVIYAQDVVMAFVGGNADWVSLR